MEEEFSLTLDDPDEVNDSTYFGEQYMRSVADNHPQLIQRFWLRWRKEYLIALREFHKSSGTNK